MPSAASDISLPLSREQSPLSFDLIASISGETTAAGNSELPAADPLATTWLQALAGKPFSAPSEARFTAGWTIVPAGKPQEGRELRRRGAASPEAPGLGTTTRAVRAPEGEAARSEGLGSPRGDDDEALLASSCPEEGQSSCNAAARRASSSSCLAS